MIRTLESYKKVVDAKLWGDFTPQKLECIGHVQRRLGTRLRKLRNEKKYKILSDGKKSSGKGRLTDKVINKTQNHYGMAIRQNPGQLHEMKKVLEQFYGTAHAYKILKLDINFVLKVSTVGVNTNVTK